MKIKWPHSGNVIIIGFIGMIIFMSFMVYAATKHNPDMVSENYYEKELHFQQNIDAEHNTLHMQFPVIIWPDSVQINIPALLVYGLVKGELKFYCPADSKLDKIYPLTSGKENYSVSTRDWKPMQYIVMINSTTHNKSYYKEFPFQKK